MDRRHRLRQMGDKLLLLGPIIAPVERVGVVAVVALCCCHPHHHPPPHARHRRRRRPRRRRGRGQAVVADPSLTTAIGSTRAHRLV